MVKMLDTPCVKCGWKLQGFHICVIDLRTKEGVKTATTVDYVPPAGRKSRARPGANRSESVKRARASEPGRTERDAEIVRLYDEELLSMNETSRRLGLDFRTVKNVLHKAAAANKIELRVNLGGRPRRVSV